MAPTTTMPSGQADAKGRSCAWPKLADDDAPSDVSAGEERGVRPVSRLARSRRDGQRDEAVRLGSAETLVSTDYYFRQYGAHGVRSLTAEVDDFGLDPHVEEKARPWLEGLCKRYFRVDVDGGQHLPSDGRVMLVCNRAGPLPWDGLVLQYGRAHGAPQLAARALVGRRRRVSLSVFGRVHAGIACKGGARPENAVESACYANGAWWRCFPRAHTARASCTKTAITACRQASGVAAASSSRSSTACPSCHGHHRRRRNQSRCSVARAFLGRALGSELRCPLRFHVPVSSARQACCPAPVKWRIGGGRDPSIFPAGAEGADDALVVHRLNESESAASCREASSNQARSSRPTRAVRLSSSPPLGGHHPRPSPPRAGDSEP